MKKLCALLLICLLALCLLPVGAAADTESDFEYTVSDGSATVTKYNGSDADVTIPDTLGGRPVTGIGMNAFSNCSSLTSVSIPPGVTSIGESAFNGCSSLASVDIPGSLTSIGNGAFRDCSALTSVSLPPSLTSIETMTFSGCSSLASVDIPGSLTSIGLYAFRYCSSLTSVSIPPRVTSIGNGAFRDCSALTSVSLPPSLTSIETMTFSGCSSLASVSIPPRVTSIGSGAFQNCSSLASVTIPPGVTSIGESAFQNCSSLASVTIPPGVTSIGESAFNGCSSLASVALPPNLTSIGHAVFAGCSSLTSVTIPNSVTSIGVNAFQACSSLTSVTIPNSVTSIGESAFYGCGSLAHIYYGGTKTEWDALGPSNFIDNYDSRVGSGSLTVHCLPEYTVSFVNADGTPLQSGLVAYGETPVCTVEPTKPADVQYTYTFAGWTPEIVPVTGDTTYTATYTGTLNEYRVTFADEDGTVLQSGPVSYGETPAYTGEPTKPATAQYSYTFAGWTPELTAVTGDASYAATYDSTVNEYTVAFVNADGTVLKSGKVPYGETPSYTGETPTKPADAQYTYTFADWDAAIVPVTGDATYTATYTSTVNEYTVTFVNADGTALQSGPVPYGETPAYTGETPTKPAEGQTTYTFAGWTPELAAVTADATYTAAFTAVTPEPAAYTVTGGGSASWTKGSLTAVVITVKRDVDDASCFSHYVETLIDGTPVAVQAKAGSTIVTIGADVLEKLSTGKHTVTVVFDDGKVETTVTIKAADPDHPKMGDESGAALWTALLCVSGGALTVLLAGRKKRKAGN